MRDSLATSGVVWCLQRESATCRAGNATEGDSAAEGNINYIKHGRLPLQDTSKGLSGHFEHPAQTHQQTSCSSGSSSMKVLPRERPSTSLHNRFCQDTVGGKLKFPVSSQNILMPDDFRQGEVECREWKKRRQTNRQQFLNDEDSGSGQSILA